MGFFDHSEESKEIYVAVVILIAVPSVLRCVSGFVENLIYKQVTKCLCDGDPLTECIRPTPRNADMGELGSQRSVRAPRVKPVPSPPAPRTMTLACVSDPPPA